jgi:hypothetical protein
LRLRKRKGATVFPGRGLPQLNHDHRFVEKKNDTLVRSWLGYRRLDTVKHTAWMNLLYNKRSLATVQLLPLVMRLVEKNLITTPEGRRQVQCRDDIPDPL